MKIEVCKYNGKHTKYTVWYWRIVASNGRELARSQMYITKSSCLDVAEKVAFYGTMDVIIEGASNE